jgi:hypothetical protein
MSDFVTTEDLAVLSLADSSVSAAPADAAPSTITSSTNGGDIDTSGVAEVPAAELTKNARAILDDQNFFRENIPRAAIVSLNKEYITCVIM